MDAYENIQRRRSVRTYSRENIPGIVYNGIDEILEKASGERAPFGSEARLCLLKDISGGRSRFSTYGFIKNPQALIACACKNDRRHLVDAGYVLEKIVLGLTGIGLATCWLGGSISRKALAEKLALKESEIIPSVISIGYEDRMSMKEKLIRTVSSGDGRHPWEKLFFREAFDRPVTKDASGIFTEPFEAVRLAPSASNRQPWRLTITERDTVVRFYLRKTPNYPGNLYGFEMQNIDIGIAACHFSAVCEEKGIKGSFLTEANVSEKDHTHYIISWKKI